MTTPRSTHHARPASRPWPCGNDARDPSGVQLGARTHAGATLDHPRSLPPWGRVPLGAGPIPDREVI